MLFWSYLADEKTESQKNEAVYFKGQLLEQEATR